MAQRASVAYQRRKFSQGVIEKNKIRERQNRSFEEEKNKIWIIFAGGFYEPNRNIL